ncbi:ribonuclease Z [Oceanospirillum linum]|uniref:Ribonuclease Z n=1 Tax=Oceanospirillum linum TaxID=966 RepID=A0A1T1HAG4_OCELI|nr:ribonuclease Z [Oceanospirillum linum]OOV86849.1 MBL fold metallo-hydrolase [Oceanospirillum linum]SEG20840.1 RNAse Z [Oleiphilus messinensis]SMP24734.1 RNAse Z [Oceanospirillum linum]
MQITFLGTSSGVPSRQRNVSATAIQPEKSRHWALVDCGEATQHQLLHTPLSPQKLSIVLITHRHGDHCYGLPGLLASCQLNGRTEPLTLVAPEAVWRYLQAVIELTDLHITYPLQFVAVNSALSLNIAGFRITAHPLSHRVPSWAYRFEETGIPKKLNLARLKEDGIPSGHHYACLQAGEDVELPDGRVLNSAEYTFDSWSARTVVIAGDNDTPELLSEACRGADLLVHESTYTQEVLEHVGPEPQHSSAERVARFAASAGLRNLMLTHFSPRYLKKARKKRDRSIEEIRHEARLHYSGRLFLAEDFEAYVLDRNGRCHYVQNLKRDHHRQPGKQSSTRGAPVKKEE